MKKTILLIIALCPLILFAQKPDTRAQKKQERRTRIENLRSQAEEDAIIFNKQTAFILKLATDGYGAGVEFGKMITQKKSRLIFFELGERKHPKEEKVSLGGFGLNPYVYGKRNNFYFAKLGYTMQMLIGGKGNKNGVAVSAVYGGGFSAGLLKPYYLEVVDGGKTRDIRYHGDNSHDDSLFYVFDPNIVRGSAGFTKGFNELKFVPGLHAKTALRFDYGRYNELVSAIEVGLNAEFYTQTMPIMLLNEEKRFFFNAYVSLLFGKRN